LGPHSAREAMGWGYPRSFGFSWTQDGKYSLRREGCTLWVTPGPPNRIRGSLNSKPHGRKKKNAAANSVIWS